MDRELLIEIGCEELPATWLPALTDQWAAVLGRALDDARLAVTAPLETYATPRRLTARVARLTDRQTDLEETVTGPPVSAAFGTDDAPTPAALGFARKHGVGVEDLQRVETPKGVYLAASRTHRGRAAVEVLPDVLAGALRALTFPKRMRWDAMLADGRGELEFGRPIRWLLFLFGGRVVPFVIDRSPHAASEHVHEVRSGSVTYGHRFLATSGRPGRALKVKTFDDYRAKLDEHFVVLERQERRDRIDRELDVHASRLGGRIALRGRSQLALLDEVPDLVEYPSVIAGTFSPDFLPLPEEVLTTAMIHHQHYFPVADDEGRLKPAFLAVTNTRPDVDRTITGNSERVLTARLRDAQFFWNADRAHPLATGLDRLGRVLVHARLGSYLEKAHRLEHLAGWIASQALGLRADAGHASAAGRLAKIDLTSEMVREFTELQGTMGGIYAREDGLPEQVWKAIYYQYSPVGVEGDEPPTAGDLDVAAGAWAALALADRVDSLVGLHGAGERASGTRDPFGMRRQAQGLIKVLVDLPDLTPSSEAPSLGALVGAAAEALRSALQGVEGAAARLEDAGLGPLYEFLVDRLRHLLEVRGARYDEVKAVLEPFAGQEAAVRPLDVRRRVEALESLRASDDLQALAVLFKRVKNIARELPSGDGAARSEAESAVDGGLVEPAERELAGALEACVPRVRAAVGTADYRGAFRAAATLRGPIDRFFTEVFVMVEDERVRQARLRLMAELRDLVLGLADISELVWSTET